MKVLNNVNSCNLRPRKKYYLRQNKGAQNKKLPQRHQRKNILKNLLIFLISNYLKANLLRMQSQNKSCLLRRRKKNRRKHLPLSMLSKQQKKYSHAKHNKSNHHRYKLQHINLNSWTITNSITKLRRKRNLKSIMNKLAII